jgi:putative membrane protein
MNMARKIFLDDMKHLLRNFLVLVIILGVSVLPALYAWLNIYSNWDPYGNTQNLTLAAVSLDRDYITEDQTTENTGKQILESLKENKKIHWVFPDSKEDAIEGVRSGKYYGALVVPKDFTYSMYNVFTKNVDRPSITFYQNQKKNPVANKITDTVAETVLSNVNNQFIEVMAKSVFTDANGLAEDIKAQGGVDQIISRMEDLNTELKNYESVIDQVQTSNAALSEAVSAASDDVAKAEKGTSNESQSLKETGDSIDAARQSVQAFSNDVDQRIADLQTKLSSMSDQLAAIDPSQTDLSKEASTKANQEISQLKDKEKAASEEADSIQKELETLRDSMSEETDWEKNLKTALNQMLSTAGQIENQLQQLENDQTAREITSQMIQNLKTRYADASAQVQNLRNQYKNQLLPVMNSALDSASQTLDQASSLMSSMSDTLSGMGNVFGALQVTISSGNTSLTNTKEVLSALSDRLTETIDKVRTAKEDEKVKILMNTLSGDPNLYASFFSSPVTIKSSAIYPVANYGSSVTPFYTTLAIWVGALILTAVMKVRPDKKRYPGSTSAERFFGRFFTFLTLAELQTLVTVLGDLFLFKVQCLHPFRFWFACAFASLTFTLLIYSLVVAFHDVGKAIAVVLVVIQIAGSSGTYPIELLPEFFRKVYIFFPFPYAINAMRECIGGMYGHNYEFYLLQESVFLLVSLGIGLLVQKPLHELSHFMEKRMHDTEMM